MGCRAPQQVAERRKGLGCSNGVLLEALQCSAHQGTRTAHRRSAARAGSTAAVSQYHVRALVPQKRLQGKKGMHCIKFGGTVLP